MTGLPLKLLFSATDEAHDLYAASTEIAQQAGATAEEPLKLLAYAQSALTRGGPDLCLNLSHALRVIKCIATVSVPTTWAENLQSLSFLDTRAFIWGSFELACAYLARDTALEDNPIIALDALFIMHETMRHFEDPKSVHHYKGHDREFRKCSESVWRTLWAGRDRLLSSDGIVDTMRWYIGTQLLHTWATLCKSFRCLPAWGTSDVFWLVTFLWMNQPNTEVEDPAPLLACIQILDSIGSKSSVELYGADRSARLAAIIDQLADTYGLDAVLRRFKESLGYGNISVGRQHMVRALAYQYGMLVPSLRCRLWDAGVMEAYIQSNRRKQGTEYWGTYDVDVMFHMILALVKANDGSEIRHDIVDTLITKERLGRYFLLPGLWSLLESLCIPHGDGKNPPGRTEINILRLISKNAKHNRTAEKGTPGCAALDTLKADVSPYWHVMNNAIQDSKPIQFEAFRQMGHVGRAWQQLGEALEINTQRAPRLIEGYIPAAHPFCAWPLCVYHTQKPPRGLKACKGCAEVLYCGRQCQTSDWKLNDHKARCRRLKG
ncbi:unnamed protein product [Peniophora sp. CBMAI 1063]|nr:unnamed protein product [Peniophora sp. CBMAI 1063]